MQEVKTEVSEGNRIIAEFDGLIKTYNSNGVMFSKDGLKYPEELLYHTSWDWQIPAWSKTINEIRKAGIAEEEIRNPKLDKYFELKRRYGECVYNNKTEEGFKILIEAIKWYNSNNPTS